MEEAQTYGMSPGFLYVPVRDAIASRDLSRHHYMAIVFAPANAVDRALFGGPGPIMGITWGLSDPAQPPDVALP
jgi:hypothetical protein